MAPPKYQPFRFIWDRFNWHAFLLKKERLYDRIYAVVAIGLIGTTIYQGVSAFQHWNATLQHTYQHYVKKEKVRQELAELVRLARESGALPPSDVNSAT
ncbi:hypothetical protein CSUI_003712 [Cystoisospora suis]|uniref:Transmembrane protein n=1 Tax=Cystoisospora suis TaxID=483139 RepID=A0A2C6KEK3_9APIC|nr:hypothetical protein CSUI_003712 [Cystoisospora suis]